MLTAPFSSIYCYYRHHHGGIMNRWMIIGSQKTLCTRNLLTGYVKVGRSHGDITHVWSWSLYAGFRLNGATWRMKGTSVEAAFKGRIHLRWNGTVKPSYFLVASALLRYRWPTPRILSLFVYIWIFDSNQSLRYPVEVWVRGVIDVYALYAYTTMCNIFTSDWFLWFWLNMFGVGW